MASWSDVAGLALSLPETTERTDRDGLRTWAVRDQMFAWERPLRPSERESLGNDVPSGPILGVRVADLATKKVILATGVAGCFTTPHFDGYSTLLVSLDDISAEELDKLILEAWLARAPTWLASACLSSE